ncbi:hypothetical protein DV704_07965 [Meiothermus sp. QL-1]|uniref:hypothetical protein n=1 Tax=Meiothermus sp. QL-1 TaxID=2058095 RepID=UPI000E0C2314|nr:hypothetical protein [Meiothermus sp. QL-1]RDI95237.1 hypothetical protein DV704_07965 [Meiothermus sp. QL-1]
MGKYDERLKGLTQAEIIARLEGPGGLLAFSSHELYYIDDTKAQSARLSQIRRVGLNRQSGTVDVTGPEGTLIAIPPAAFQKDELRLFLESLKNHILRARAEPPSPEPPKAPSLVDEPAEPPILTPSENRLPPNPIPEKTQAVEPPKTLPDEPPDMPRGSETSPRPPLDPAPTLPPPAQAKPSLGRGPRPTQRLTSFLLKVSTLITAAVTAGYLVAHMGTTADIWSPLGVTAVGLALALIQWHLSELS